MLPSSRSTLLKKARIIDKQKYTVNQKEIQQLKNHDHCKVNVYKCNTKIRSEHKAVKQNPERRHAEQKT